MIFDQIQVRFYIPPGEEEEGGAEAFHRSVLERTNVQSTTGDALVTFSEEEVRGLLRVCGWLASRVCV